MVGGEVVGVFGIFSIVPNEAFVRERPAIVIEANQIAVIVLVQSLVLRAQAKHHAGSEDLIIDRHLPIVVVSVLSKWMRAPDGDSAFGAFRVEANLQFVVAEQSLLLR